MAQHNDLGNDGEKLAVDFLIKNGYAILETNYHFHKAEVDIIAQKDNVLAVVEVKTRATDYFGDPQDFVKPKKIKLLVGAIDDYVISRNLDVDVRFDIIGIIKNNKGIRLEHLEDAFLHF
ncbi:MAG: YraN family protein [Flavobacteriales bacterium]|nr:YraN family protein [Flavobacteriales bacterium]